MKRLAIVGTTLASILFSGCDGAVTAEKLASTWTCEGQGRPTYEFSVDGTYVNDTLPDPNSAYPEGRATGKVEGTYGVKSGVLTLTPKRIRFAVAPQDFMYYAQAANSSGGLRKIANTTFEVAPGSAYTVLNAKLSKDTLTLQVSKRVNGKGQAVNPPNGQWAPFECTRG